jgi:hypothetical protein
MRLFLVFKLNLCIEVEFVYSSRSNSKCFWLVVLLNWGGLENSLLFCPTEQKGYRVDKPRDSGNLCRVCAPLSKTGLSSILSFQHTNL